MTLRTLDLRVAKRHGLIRETPSGRRYMYDGACMWWSLLPHHDVHICEGHSVGEPYASDLKWLENSVASRPLRPPPPPKEPAMTLEQVLTRVEEAIRENTQARVVGNQVLTDLSGRLATPAAPMTATEVAQLQRRSPWRPTPLQVAVVRQIVHEGYSRETISAIEAVCSWAERSP